MDTEEYLKRYAAMRHFYKDNTARLMFLRSFQPALSWRVVCRILFTGDRMFGRPCVEEYPT